MYSAKKASIFSLLLVLLVSLPMMSWAQRKNWYKTIELKDRRDDGVQTVVAKVTFVAYMMTTPTSPGSPVAGIEKGPNSFDVEPIKFPGIESGYIKFKISNIDWTPAGKEYDGSNDYKVIVRNVWVDMAPQIYIEKKKGLTLNLRKRYITAPNVEYVKGDSLPPPTIFKVDKNSNYTFTIGIKAVTPKTVEEKPFEFAFNFGIEGLTSSIESTVVLPPDPVDPIPAAPTNTPPPVDNSVNPEIDAAIQRAIDEERVDDLIGLIKDNPLLTSAKKARSLLTLKMTKELVDSVTYRVDISYVNFTRATPTKSDINLGFSRFGAALPENALNPTWRDGKLFVRPPKDSIDYVVSAAHKILPDKKASIVLNSVKDYITFSYAETVEDRVSIKVKGGHGPYNLFMQSVSGGDYYAVEGSMRIMGDTVLDKERIARVYNFSEEGDFRLYLVDAEQLKKTGAGTIHLVPLPPIPPIVWYIGLGLLVLSFIGFLFYRREKRRKDEELEKLLDARGGADPRVKRKPRPELQEFWKETAISELSLHKNFVREVSTYLKERPHRNGEMPLVEGVILGTVLKFDFENEQYQVRLDRFRAIDAKPINYYDERGDDESWAEIREVALDHRDLVKIGWLQVAEGRPMRLTKSELQFQDEQFSELFQLLLKIDIVDGKRLCGFFTRTTSGKLNDVGDRLDGVDAWLNWDELEDAGYYESSSKSVQTDGEGGKIRVKLKDQETA